jgi:hypothetical protein
MKHGRIIAEHFQPDLRWPTGADACVKSDSRRRFPILKDIAGIDFLELNLDEQGERTRRVAVDARNFVDDFLFHRLGENAGWR